MNITINDIKCKCLCVTQFEYAKTVEFENRREFNRVVIELMIKYPTAFFTTFNSENTMEISLFKSSEIPFTVTLE